MNDMEGSDITVVTWGKIPKFDIKKNILSDKKDIFEEVSDLRQDCRIGISYEQLMLGSCRIW